MLFAQMFFHFPLPKGPYLNINFPCIDQERKKDPKENSVGFNATQC